MGRFASETPSKDEFVGICHRRYVGANLALAWPFFFGNPVYSLSSESDYVEFTDRFTPMYLQVPKFRCEPWAIDAIERSPIPLATLGRNCTDLKL